jgi:3-deoxy-D-manno-octulosonic-acid transferase
MVWRLLYNIVLPFGLSLFYFLSLFKRKVRRGIRGRKNLFERLEKEVAVLPAGAKRVWFHSSSMGEFEQAKPLIAGLKQRHPDVEIIVTFFSPSGYDHTKNYRLASIITYLPLDTRSNAQKFIRLVQPTATVLMRYDVWPNHLWELQKAGIPVFIVNATLRKNTLREIPVIKQFHQEMYNSIDYILTVSEEDKKTFEQFFLSHPAIEVVGDTRYDQVWQRCVESRQHHYLPSTVLSGKKVFVIGSSWQEDEEVLFPVLEKLLGEEKQLLVLLVPHEPHLETLERIETSLNGMISTIRFSMLNDYRNESIVIVDSVGILMALYQYADAAFVGGSFRQGVHSVLEPAVYGVPLIIGPKHENSQEAIKLIEMGAAVVGENSERLYEHIRAILQDGVLKKTMGEKAQEFVRSNIGATHRVLSYLEKVL